MKTIESLLKKKHLTGKEAALLIIADNFAFFMSDGRVNTLKKTDREAIVQAVEGDQHVKDFNAFLHIGDQIERTYIVLDAVKGVIAEKLLRMNLAMTDYHYEVERIHREVYTPQVMSQKQYEEMKALQRKMLLDEPVSLAHVVVHLADSAYPDISVFYPTKEEADGMADIFEYDEAVDELAKDYPEAYEAGYKKLAEMIESGQLIVDISEKRKLTPRSFSLLKKTFVRREALYKLGYWVEYIDTYHPNMNHETGGTWSGVAILQEPEPYQLDDRGYYIDQYSIRTAKKTAEMKDRAEEVWSGVVSTIRYVKKTLRSVYRYAAVVEAYSDIMGYDFRKHLDVILKNISKTVNLFNERLEDTFVSFYPPRTKPELIDLASLQPSPEAVKKVKEVIDIRKEPWEELFAVLRQSARRREDPDEPDEEYP